MAKFSFDDQEYYLNTLGGVRDFTVVELHSEGADHADEDIGMVHVAPTKADGKFPIKTGVNSDIIVQVIPPWLIRPEAGTYRLDIEGTVIGGEALALNYDGQSVVFTRTALVTGVASGAQGIIMIDSVPGLGDGILTLGEVFGTFQNNETITDQTGGTALADGVGTIVRVSPIADPPSGSVQTFINFGSQGIYLSPATAAAIASAVMEEQMAGHMTAGSFGKLINDMDLLLEKVYGLGNANSKYSDVVYDAGDHVTSMKITGYDRPADDPGAIAIVAFLHTATYSGDRILTLKIDEVAP